MAADARCDYSRCDDGTTVRSAFMWAQDAVCTAAMLLMDLNVGGMGTVESSAQYAQYCAEFVGT